MGRDVLLHTWNMEFMQRALDLAERVAGGLAPRPAVGAVIVARDGETIVGEGATQPNPGPHAEAVALNIAQSIAKGDSEGGTIYCTLEPHQNRSTTPPCTQAIIDAGISTVVCPTVDPNPLVAGRGFEHLKSAGIQIINDVDNVSQRRANELIEGFAKHINTGLPFVTVKWAMSLDGKIATRNGDSKWITGPAARDSRPHPPLPRRRRNDRHRHRSRRQPTPNRPPPDLRETHVWSPLHPRRNRQQRQDASMMPQSSKKKAK